MTCNFAGTDELRTAAIGNVGMRAYLACYDLNSPGQDYSDLFKAIKAVAEAWWHNLDSTWIVISRLKAVEIRDQLATHIDPNDELLVARLGTELAWTGFGKDASDWLSTELDSVVA
jgi:hypothetical protein